MTYLYDGMTPAEVLDRHPSLTMTQAAFVLQLVHIRGEKKGQPDRRRFIKLLSDNPKRLWVIDDRMPSAKWLISADLMRDFLKGHR